MTSASSLAFPGSRTLATWWQQLAPFRPQAFCVGYFFVHRLEAPAGWLQAQPLEPLLLLALVAFHLEQQGKALPTESFYGRLRRRLGLDMPVIRGLAHALRELNMLGREAPAAASEPTCLVTEQGREALRTGKVWSRQWLRGTFPFLERMGPTGQRLAPPHYLNIADSPAAPWHVEEAAVIDVACLGACLEQSPTWKTTFGFPLDVVAFPEPPTRGATVAEDQVIIDRPERLLAVFLEGGEHELLGFGVRPEGWLLDAAKPIVRLPNAAMSALDLTRSAATPTWKQAWQSWCQPRSLPRADVDDCSLALIEDSCRASTHPGPPGTRTPNQSFHAGDGGRASPPAAPSAEPSSRRV